MFQRNLVRAAALCCAGTPALADLTPEQVWNDWTAELDRSDAKYQTSSIDQTSDGLTIKGFDMTAESEGGSYSIAVERIDLRQGPNGAVAVTMSPSYPITLSQTDEDGVERQTVLSVRHPDLMLTVAEDGEAIRHSFVAPELTVSLESVTADGAPVDIAGSLVIRDAAGVYTPAGSEAAGAESGLEAASVTFAVAGSEPDDDGAFDIALSFEGVRSSNLLSFLDTGSGDLAEQLRGGLQRKAALDYSASAYVVESSAQGDTIVLEGGSGPGEIAADLSVDGLRYESRSIDSRLGVAGSSVPLPRVDIAMAENVTRLLVPVLGNDAPQDFELALRLSDVVLDEALWSMIDPAGILPRDPASLGVALSGLARIEDDVVGPPDMEHTPGQIETLSIDDLRLSLAGAELTGMGDLSFRDTPEGPQPLGAVDLTLVGGNALIDRLVQAGLIPQDQAMGARMMLSMFATEGDGPDEHVSRIEFTEDGGVAINDQLLP